MRELVNDIKHLISDRNPDGVKEEIKSLILSKKMEMKK